MVKKNIKDISVLIVDDNLVNQKVVSFNIQRLGLIPHIAENGKIALNKFQETPYDLVLMDIMMPVMDGLEATRKIRSLEAGKQAVIIAISANYIEEERDNYLSNGLDDIIPKPLDFSKLQYLLTQYFEF